jgi:hypothetical protein
MPGALFAEAVEQHASTAGQGLHSIRRLALSVCGGQVLEADTVAERTGMHALSRRWARKLATARLWRLPSVLG